MRTTVKSLVFSLCCLGCFGSTCYAIHLESSMATIQQHVGNTSENVVIFPFADYTRDSSFESVFRRNTLIQEAVRDELYRRRIYSAEQDDVQQYFLQAGIIQVDTSSTPTALSTTEAFGISNWNTENQPEVHNIQTVGVDRTTLLKVANEFHAKYALRGRILEFKFEDTDSILPYRTGVLPFVFKVGSRLIYGFGNADAYDLHRSLNVSTLPIVGGTELQPVLQHVIDGGASLLGLRSGEVKEAIIHVRLSLQDLKTGEVVWTNRGQVKASASNFLSEHRDRELQLAAIRNSICTIFSTFPTLSEKPFAEPLPEPALPSNTQIQFKSLFQEPETTTKPCASCLNPPSKIDVEGDAWDTTFQETDAAFEQLKSQLDQLVSEKEILATSTRLASFDILTFQRPHKLRSGFKFENASMHKQSALRALSEAEYQTSHLSKQQVNKPRMMKDLREMQVVLKGQRS